MTSEVEAVVVVSLDVELRFQQSCSPPNMEEGSKGSDRDSVMGRGSTVRRGSSGIASATGGRRAGDRALDGRMVIGDHARAKQEMKEAGMNMSGRWRNA